LQFSSHDSSQLDEHEVCCPAELTLSHDASQLESHPLEQTVPPFSRSTTSASLRCLSWFKSTSRPYASSSSFSAFGLVAHVHRRVGALLAPD